MNRYAWPVCIVAFVAILAAGCSQATSPTVTVTVTSPAGSSPSAASPTAAATPPTPPPPTATATVCISPTIRCAGEMRTEPTQLLLSGDSSVFVRRLTWSGWGTATAQGSGTLEIDNCNPNCAQGSLTRYPATITLSGLTPYGSGQQGYANMTVSAPGSPYGTHHFAHLLP